MEEKRPGEVIKNYMIEYMIGKGQFGYVYRIVDKNDIKKIYALKQIEIKENSEYLERAIKLEIEIMKKVQNENSVKLIENFDDDYYHYLVLELCDDNLDKIFRSKIKKTKKSYNELEVYMIMIQLNNCFKKMREGEKKVIHRDLKLENILIEYNEKIPIIGFSVKLSDFGLSKEMTDNDVTKTRVGTPMTQAPEILLEQKYHTQYNSKVDLWSIGIIIYQLLYMRSIPFNTMGRRQLIEDIEKFNRLILPNDKRNIISDECFDLLNKLLVKNPQERIDFDDYFGHKFFSEEHRNELIKKYGKPGDEKLFKKNEVIEIKRFKLKLNEFEEKFLKMRLLKDYGGLKLYKGKDNKNNNIVYIKEIKRDIIDKSKENTNIFNKEIKLLSTFNGPNFPKCKEIYETQTFYFFIFEYFSGNILDDYIINRKGILSESLKNSIIMQLKPSFLELKKKNIILKNISSKSLIFSYYQNEHNFLIKIYDYFINSIFFKNNNDNSLYFTFEDFINPENDKNKDNSSNSNNYSQNMKPVIKDEELENLFEIIKNKIEFIINYFEELLDDENILQRETISDYFKEIIIFLYFCIMECKIVFNFLNINSDKNMNDIEKDAQEIHLLKIYLNEENKYDYTYINFLEHPTIWYYNKDNPSFSYYINIFHNLKNKLDSILNMYIENNRNKFTIIQNDKKESNNNIDIESINIIEEKCIKEGNLEQLFSKFFENIISIYPTEKRSKISKELNLMKYILEYIIFIKLIFKKENSSIPNFETIFENSNNTISFCSFIGNKIKYYKEKNIFNANVFDNKDESIENILLNKFINFYIKMIKFNS